MHDGALVDTRSPAHVAFGTAMRRRRAELGLSQEELGNRCGLHRTYISGIERGERNPSLTNVLAVAEGLELSASALLARAESL